MRPIIVLSLLAAMTLFSGCLASLPVKVKAGAGTDGPAKLKELPGGVTVITDDKWDLEVVQASNDFPVVVDMYADWCGPCRRLSPIIDEISKENRQVKFVKINTDNSQKAKSMGINAIPVLVVFKDGVEVKRLVGLMPKDELVAAFAAL